MADPNTTGIPRPTEIRSTALIAAECSDRVRSFQIITKAGEVFEEKVPVLQPLTAAVVDDIIAALGSTETPLQDLIAVVAEVRTLCARYEEVNGATASVKRPVRARQICL